MSGCSRWPLRVLFVVLTYIISTYMIYDAIGRLALTIRPGVEVLVFIVLYNSIIAVVSLASTVIIMYTTGSLIAASSIPLSLVMLVLSSPYRWVLASSLLLVLAVLGLLILVQVARGRLAEPVIDLVVKTRLSPTALVAAALTLYISWSLIASRALCELSTVYVASSIAAAFIASVSSYSIWESLVLGAIAGLGPLGLSITASYASSKPLVLEPCSGVYVGELVGFVEVASRSRALLPVTGEPRGRIMVCSQPSRAVLEVEEPWIIWVYGLDSKRVAEAIALNLGGGVALSLEEPGPRITDIEKAVGEALEQASGGVAKIGLGSIEPYEARIALIPAIAETLKQAKTLILEVLVPSREQLIRIAFETSRRHPRLIVTLPEIPWSGETLAPRGPAKTSAFIVTRLTDPQQAENIAKTLLPRQSSELKEAILTGKIVIAYPGCKNKLIAIKKTG